MEDLLKEFSKLASRKYMVNDVPNYAYAAGYYESVLKSMFLRLPEQDQQHFMSIMQGGLKGLQGE